ncbi:MAG: hypothetical protein IAF38_02570 [Bacteroidia bacterium]|nr:hypothetical protein [Bacteroidia bacterium]
MTEKDEFNELDPEEKIQAENELLKLKLQAEFGMGKLETKTGGEIENAFLKHVYEFEKQFAENKQIKLYDFIGRPEFKKAEGLSKKEISEELQKITEIFNENGIELSCLCEYENEMIYRFITEELFEHEMEDMRISGMTTHFTYEEFHPNHDYDIRDHAMNFITRLINHQWDEFMNNILLTKSVSYNGNVFERKLFVAIIKEFQNAEGKTELLSFEIESVVFDLETENGTAEGFIEYTSERSGKITSGKIELGFKLEFDYWCVSKVVLPGFSNLENQ